jgi:hypothetical protein
MKLQMIKKSLIAASLVLTLLLNAHQVNAQTNNSGSSVFGPIEAPAGVAELNKQAGVNSNNIGLLIFVSNMIKLASVVAGVWVLFNFISAGFTYITSAGDSNAYAKIGEKLALSATGLVLIVAAYTIAGIIGLIIFGNPTYILNPQIPSAIGT